MVKQFSFTAYYKPLTLEQRVTGPSTEKRDLYDENKKIIGYVVSSRNQINVASSSNYIPYQVLKSFCFNDGVLPGLSGGGILTTGWTPVADLDVVGTPLYTQGNLQNAKHITFKRTVATGILPQGGGLMQLGFNQIGLAYC